MGSSWCFRKICLRKSRNNNEEFPIFIFSSGKLTHDPGSPLPPCCETPGECRPYLRNEDDSERVVGMYCKNCHAEWLDETIHSVSKFNRNDKIAVTVVNIKDASFEMTTSGGFDVSCATKYSPTLVRRFPSTDGITDFFRFLLISIPKRTIIERGTSAMDTLQPGDHIMWHRPWAVWHHQLIRRRTGPNTYDIIHFDTRNDAKFGFKVEILEKHARNFAEEHGTLYRVNYSARVKKENPEALVFDRANAKLHERDYNLFTHNCEHVISFCKTGCVRSYQVGWLKKEILFLFLRAVIIFLVILLASIADTGLTNGCDQHNNVNLTITPIAIIPHVTSSTVSPVTSYTVTSYTTPSSKCHHTVHKSEIIEGVSITIFEILMFVFVIWRHIKAFKDSGIDRVDLFRRVGEAIVELVLTISFYSSHILIVYLLQTATLGVDILLGVLLGISGKIIGFFFGQYICQKTVRRYHSSSITRGSKSDCLLDGERVSIASYNSFESSSRNQLA